MPQANTPRKAEGGQIDIPWMWIHLVCECSGLSLRLSGGYQCRLVESIRLLQHEDSMMFSPTDGKEVDP